MSRRNHRRAPFASAAALVSRRLPALLLAACAAIPPPAGAVIVEWDDPSSGSWTDAANWSPVGVPGGGDDARITVNASPYDVRLQLTNRSVNSVQVNASNARLLLEGATLNVATGVTVGAGELRLSNSGSPQSLLNAQSLFIAGGASASVTRSNLATSVTNLGDLTLNFLHMSNVDGAGGTASFTNDGSTRMLGSGLFNRISAATVNNGSFLLGTDAQPGASGDLLDFDNAGGGVLSVTGSRLKLANTDLDNFGLLELRGASSAVERITPSFIGGLVNHAGGVVDVQAGGNHDIRVRLQNDGTLNVASDLDLDAGNFAHESNGSINITGGVGGGNLTVQGGSFTNRGLIDASTGGGLTFFNNIVNDVGGTIDVGTGGLLIDNNNGGVTNNGAISVDGGNATIRNVTTLNNNGAILVAAGSALDISRTSVGSTTVNLGAGATLGGGGTVDITRATLNLDGDYSPGASQLNLVNVHVAGPGTLRNRSTMTMRQAGLFNRISATTVNETGALFEARGGNVDLLAFTNEAGATLRVDGGVTGNSRVNVANTDLVNRGLIELMSSSATPNTARIGQLSAGFIGALVNEAGGVVDVLAGGNRELDLRIDNRGTLNVGEDLRVDVNVAAHTNAGVLNLGAGTTTRFQGIGSSLTNQSGGVIQGNGTLDVSAIGFVDRGTIAPGSSFGTLEILGNYLQDAGAVLDLEIGGLAPGQHDRLVVTGGSATLNGILRLTFLDDFAPLAGDVLDLIAGDVVANFSDIQILNLAPGFDFLTAGGPGGFTLTALNDAVFTGPTVSDAPEPPPATLLLAGLLLLRVLRGTRGARAHA